MELVNHSCKKCGGQLQPIGEGKLKCPYCASIYNEESAQKHTQQMQELFDEVKQEKINNLRRNLYNAIHAEYVSSNEVHDVCTALKQYLPDDFQANFYDIATGSNVRHITNAIRYINVEAHFDDIDEVIKYLVRNLQAEYLLELNNLVERAYKNRDLIKFEEYSTAISEEAQKVQMGIYETKLPREVFVAYSSKDMDKVSELVEVLESQGMKCFVAARNLRHGKGAVENYDKALKEAMDHCKSFVFVSSRNSRSISCDALEIELPYVQKKDIENAPAEYRNNYSAIPARYKKPRVEYRVEESIGANAADIITNEFFNGYERVYSPSEVAHRIMQQLIQTPSDEPMQASKSNYEAVPKKYCAKCGHENEVTTNFCAQCGNTEFLNSVAEFIQATNQKQEELRRKAEQELLAEKRKAEAARQAEEKAKREAEAAKSSASTYSAGAYSSYATTSSSYKPSSSYNSTAMRSDKGEWAALLLCIFFGLFGAHRFYVGKKKSGVLYLFTLGCFGIGMFVDLIRILNGKFKDEYGYLVGFENTGHRSGGAKFGRFIAIVYGLYMMAVSILIIVAIIVGISGGFDEGGKLEDINTPEIGNQITDSAYPDLVFTMEAGGYSVSVDPNKSNDLSGVLEIPSDVNGVAVTSISKEAFLNCTNVTEVIIPNSVTTIGEGAFNGCSGIRKITIPFVGQSKTAINETALFGYIFGQVAYGGGSAIKQHISFGGHSRTFYVPTQLSEVTLTNTQTIPECAFENCVSIKAVNLNDGVISIGKGAFKGCSSLTSLTLPDGVTEISEELMSGCVALEEFNYGDDVTVIGVKAFYNCAALEKLDSDESGTFIISDNVTSVGKGALSGCVKLKSLIIPFVGESKTATADASSFGYIFGEDNYNGGAQVQQMHKGSSGTYTRTYYIPAQLKKVEVTNTTQLSSFAFDNCSSLTEIILTDKIVNVGIYAFRGCSSIKEISLPMISEVSAGMLQNCSSLEYFEIGSDVTKIDTNAFSGCTELSRLNSDTDGMFIIPNSVTSIGRAAFAGCVRVTDITLPFVGLSRTASATEGNFGYIFGEDNYAGGISVSQKHQGSSGVYSKTYYIPPQLKKVTITNANNLAYGAFSNCSMLTEININSLAQNSIGDKAFDGCTATVNYY